MTIQSLDTQLLLLINQGMSNPFFDVLMPMLSLRGYLLITPFLFYIIISGFFRKHGSRKKQVFESVLAIIIACFAVYLADGIEHLVKNAVGRIRPCSAIEGIRLILPCPKSPSMPSGHALSSFAFAVPLFYLMRMYLTMGWRMYPLILAALIAFSRSYLGVHYPTDILAGAIMGTIIGLTLSWGYETLSRSRKAA